jgi:hypothetical protein
LKRPELLMNWCKSCSAGSSLKPFRTSTAEAFKGTLIAPSSSAF